MAVAAFAYEIENDPIMSDDEFDELASTINPSRPTGNPSLDQFFYRHFNPYTGMWIRLHPDLDGLRRIWHKYYRNQAT